MAKGVDDIGPVLRFALPNNLDKSPKRDFNQLFSAILIGFSIAIYVKCRINHGEHQTSSQVYYINTHVGFNFLTIYICSSSQMSPLFTKKLFIKY